MKDLNVLHIWGVFVLLKSQLWVIGTAQEGLLPTSELGMLIRDVVLSMDIRHVLLVTSNTKGDDDRIASEVLRENQSPSVGYSVYSVSANQSVNEVLEFQERKLKAFEPLLTVYLVPLSTLQSLMTQVLEANIFQRFFYFLCRGTSREMRALEAAVIEPIKVLFLQSDPIKRTNESRWKIYYSQGSAQFPSRFVHVNDWTMKGKDTSEIAGWKGEKDFPNAFLGSFDRSPVVPEAAQVYGDFGGRLLRKPVLTAEPYVKVLKVAENGTVLSVVGRDINIAQTIAQALNFRLHFFEPQERSWGSGFKADGHFPGMVGTVYRRESDLLIDSVTLTNRRFQAIDYSFITHDDSACFITRAPQQVSTASAVIRPFTVTVWMILLTFVLFSSVFFFLLSRARASLESGQKQSQSSLQSVFLLTFQSLIRQTLHVQIQGNSRRVFYICWVMFALLVTIMYSANLTSFYAYPGYEKALNSLDELLFAMKRKEIYLGVENGGSTESMIRNGGGILSDIWAVMEKDQGRNLRLSTNNEGMARVLEKGNFAWVGGRGLISFAVNKIGVRKFHINRDLFISPKYKAAVVQKACPFLPLVDHVMMRLFEAGLTDKWMQDEYWKIQLQRSRDPEEEDSEEQARAISVAGLFGPLLILGGGYLSSGVCFLLEVIVACVYKKSGRLD